MDEIINIIVKKKLVFNENEIYLTKPYKMGIL